MRCDDKTPQELREENALLRERIEKLEREHGRESDLFDTIVKKSVVLSYKYSLANGNYEYMNPACKAVLGYTAEELLGGGIEVGISRVHPDDMKVHQAGLEELLSGKVDSDFNNTVEYRYKHKTRGYRWLRDTRSVIFDADGNLTHIVGNTQDITDQKEAERALASTLDGLEVRILERTLPYEKAKNSCALLWKQPRTDSPSGTRNSTST